uniref:SAM-dependent methyltransferase, MidA family n=1 Tax=Candidatus Kentrum sp. MB TaxID=2138164 RepID=A0A450X3A9_9GAMM|nr:MAG: SAM-dependent methyltransferase, MidA family [Candidatus Kentron sp. MB]VFK26665.1 MAG: SAM-dependent methyltransferase, MidA family [Candidatus Kentron sp. MB]VFK74590.1 MAG: SAM-dependent methyltransferase, MidA family [Candidatus Kentron sp. MB]
MEPFFNPHLPDPADSDVERSHALGALIRAEIKDAHRSAISFSRFMELALYTPELGYYQSDAPKFGEQGDFVTAPEISPLFSHCIARQVREVLIRLGQGDLLEVGAGSGNLAVDLLQALSQQDAFLKPSLPERYLILERSAALRRQQEETIRIRAPALFPRFQWLDDLPKPGFRGVIVANELLDAMPANRFLIQDGQVREWMVGWNGKEFIWQSASSPSKVEQAVRHIEQDLGESFPDNYSSELHLMQMDWVREAARRIEAGLLLLLDYGYPRREYYHPERTSGTLTCHYRHRMHDDPFFLPGLQDIGAHVDFSAIAQAGTPTLQLAGFTTQRDFLIATGLTDLCAGIDPLSRRYMTLAQGIKQLVLPGEMGDIVKVMGFTRGLDIDGLQGFTGFDLRGRL